MSMKYRKGYKIYKVSEDGLLKQPKSLKYYYDPYTLDEFYDTEEQAMNDIEKHKLGECVIITVYTECWISDDE